MCSLYTSEENITSAYISIIIKYLYYLSTPAVYTVLAQPP